MSDEDFDPNQFDEMEIVEKEKSETSEIVDSEEEESIIDSEDEEYEEEEEEPV